MSIQKYIQRAESNIPITRLSTLLATSNLIVGAVLLVEKKITTAGPTVRKEHGPDMIMIKAEISFEPMDS